MSKGLKVWLWVIIAANILAILADFVLVSGNLGFVFACFNLFVIICIVNILKFNIKATYYYLAIRVLEAILAILISTTIYEITPLLRQGLDLIGIGYSPFVITFTSVRVLAAIVTTLVCMFGKQKSENEI